MPVPTSRSDLSTTPSSNSPAGADAVFPNLDNYLRAAFAFIAQNYADISTFNAALIARVPVGLISLWSGSAAAIPSGWALCDGSSGTPDLRNRFVVGAGSTYAVAATGGATSAASDSQGAHTHTLPAATDSHALTVAQMPEHKHITYYGEAATFPNGETGTGKLGSNASDSDNVWPYSSSEGGSTGHTHGITGPTGSDGAHTHTTATLPPYYALCYIMRT